MYATIGCFFFTDGLVTTTTLCMPIHIIGDANLEMKKGGKARQKNVLQVPV